MVDKREAHRLIIDQRIGQKAIVEMTGAEFATDPIALEMPDGSVKAFRFHACCYSRNPYLMIAKPPVEDGIYVLVVVRDPDLETYELAGWDWAQKLRSQPYTSAGFEGSYGHSIPRRYLRRMAEIRPRIMGPMTETAAVA